MRQAVKDFVARCYVCQTTKYSTEKPYGLLQPLETPEQVWEDIALDFIIGLPPSKGNTTILVVVDRLTKYAHFSPLPPSHTASQVAELFCTMVIRLHGIPRSIISNRDPIFTSQFWRKVFDLMGTKLRMSSAYHPQTDGQTEVLNRCLEQYLRAFTAEKPTTWVSFLGWAKYHYNTSYHSSIGTTPFQAVYGRPPPTIPAYLQGSTSVAAVEDLLIDRDEVLRRLKQHLLQTRQRMKQLADNHRQEKQFQVGDMVLIKLVPYRQTTVARRQHSKLCKRFFGPFAVISKRGPVAYTLQLPPGSRIHPTFHASQLKLFKGDSPDKIEPLPEYSINNQPLSVPICILAARVLTKRGQKIKQVLVQWSGRYPDDATWEDFHKFCSIYTQLNLEDKVAFEGVESDSPIAIEMDSQILGQQLKDWASKGFIEPEPAHMQNISEPAQSIASNTEESEEEQQECSRKRNKPIWAKDYVM